MTRQTKDYLLGFATAVMLAAAAAIGWGGQLEDARALTAVYRTEAASWAADARSQAQSAADVHRIAQRRGVDCTFGAVQTYNGGEALCLTEQARHWLAEECYRGEQWACGETMQDTTAPTDPTGFRVTP